MQDRTGLTVFLVRVVFVLFETRRFCKVARFVFPDLDKPFGYNAGLFDNDEWSGRKRATAYCEKSYNHFFYYTDCIYILRAVLV